MIHSTEPSAEQIAEQVAHSEHTAAACRASRHTRVQHLITADETSLAELEALLATLPICSTGRVFIEEGEGMVIVAGPKRYVGAIPRTSRRRGATLQMHNATISPTTARRRFARTRSEAATCRRCELWERATQTVFGVGPVPAPLMLVGEQPGDNEDLEGEPFVGPAGRILDEALGSVGIDRESVFLTNVVKHFRWRPSPTESTSGRG